MRLGVGMSAIFVRSNVLGSSLYKMRLLPNCRHHSLRQPAGWRITAIAQQGVHDAVALRWADRGQSKARASS